MVRIVLVQPGATEFDEQRRIKGSLDMPLSVNGAHQVAQIVDELAEQELDMIYTAPCQSAQQTAEALASNRRIKVKTIDKLKNLNHGLWHGKLIEEVRQTQPKVYRQWQENPHNVCPPEGETLGDAQSRVETALIKLLKKHKQGVVALVVPEPLASLVRSFLQQRHLGDLWKAECECGNWELIEVEPPRSVTSG